MRDQLPTAGMARVEDDRHPRLAQAIGGGKHLAIGQAHIEDRGAEPLGRRSDRGQRRGQRFMRAIDGKARTLGDLLNVERDEQLVFGEQQQIRHR